MSDGSAELQTAIYAALTGAGICGGRIYDDVPRPFSDALYPFVEIGESQALADDVTCSDGKDEYLTLHVWSKDPSKAAVKTIIAEIRAVLHAQVLTVSGRSSAHAFVRDERVVNDPAGDGKIRHGIVTIRVLHHA